MTEATEQAAHAVLDAAVLWFRAHDTPEKRADWGDEDHALMAAISRLVLALDAAGEVRE